MSGSEEHEYGFHFDSTGQLRSGNASIVQLVDDLVSHTDGRRLEATVKGESGEELLVAGESLLRTPLFVYNKERIVRNFKRYSDAFEARLRAAHGVDFHVSYSMKANFNPSVLKIFHGLGSWSSLVNENELRLALRVGFTGSRLIFNGNGKTLSEIELAVLADCYLNIDSRFNLVHTIGVCRALGRRAKLILRVNQPISVDVHNYLNTSFRDSKFGVVPAYIDELLELIRANEDLVELHGFHVHLGSTIKSLDVYEKAVDNIVELYKSVSSKYGFSSLKILNLGGGLGIDYEKFAARTACESDNKTSPMKLPTPADLADAIGERVKTLKGLTVVVEPGRSLIADAAILLTKVIGIKQTEHRKFIVVDGSMCEVIRPCLYSAYHFIDYIEPLPADRSSGKALTDVVGPVCESGDFLGKDRYLAYPSSSFDSSTESIYLAVFDVGAYCSSMASNYNLHSRPAEVFIANSDREKPDYILTKRSETLDSILSTFL